MSRFLKILPFLMVVISYGFPAYLDFSNYQLSPLGWLSGTAGFMALSVLVGAGVVFFRRRWAKEDLSANHTALWLLGIVIATVFPFVFYGSLLVPNSYDYRYVTAATYGLSLVFPLFGALAARWALNATFFTAKSAEEALAEDLSGHPA